MGYVDSQIHDFPVAVPISNVARGRCVAVEAPDQLLRLAHGRQMGHGQVNADGLELQDIVHILGHFQAWHLGREDGPTRVVLSLGCRWTGANM